MPFRSHFLWISEPTRQTVPTPGGIHSQTHPGAGPQDHMLVVSFSCLCVTLLAHITARPSDVKKALNLLEKDALAKEDFATGFLKYPLGRRIVQQAGAIIERNAQDILADARFDAAQTGLTALLPEAKTLFGTDLQKSVDLLGSILKHTPKLVEALQTWSRTRLTQLRGVQ